MNTTIISRLALEAKVMKLYNELTEAKKTCDELREELKRQSLQTDKDTLVKTLVMRIETLEKALSPFAYVGENELDYDDYHYQDSIIKYAGEGRVAYFDYLNAGNFWNAVLALNPKAKKPVKGE